MSEVSAPAVSTSAAPAAPKTAAQAFENLSKQPLPTVSTPTLLNPKPEPVEGAIRYEQAHTGPAVDRTIQDTAEPASEPTGEPVDATEPEAAPEPAPETVDWQQKFSEMFDSGDLHQSLHDKMLMAKIDGQEVPVSVKEALAGYMRRSNHSKAMNELAQQQHALQAEQTRFQSMWQDLGQRPDLALEVFGERFGDQWLDQMVETRQRAKAEYDNTIYGAGLRACVQLGIDPNSPEAAQDRRVLQAMAQEQTRLERARQLEAENKKLRRAQEQIEAQQQQAQTQQQAQSYEKTFNATLARFQDAALKAEGLTTNSINRAELKQAVVQVLLARNYGVPRDQQSHSVTQDVVREAAQIVKESRGTPAQAQPSAQTEPALPARMGMGTGTGAAVKPRQQAVNSRDAFKKLGL